jgi:hypothetical protein
MAINNPGNTPEQGQPRPAANPAPAAPRTDPPRQAASIFTLNNRMTRPVERAATGEVVKKFVAAFNKDAEISFLDNGSTASAEDFKMVVLDSSSDQVALSAILICYRQVFQGAINIGVFTLIIEGSGQTGLRSNRFVPIGGKNVEVEIVPGDVFNPTMWGRIEAKVQASYGAKIKVFNAGSMVLPTELSPDNASSIHRVFYNATQALFTILDTVLAQTQPPFTVSLIDKDAQKIANLDYNPLPITDAVDMPVRTDLSISLRASRPEQGNDLHEMAIEITRLDGFVDLIYSKPDMIPQGFAQIPSTQSYYPRYVITRADSDFDAFTPEMHLLAISTASLLYNSNAWMSAFLPRYNDESELRDLGAVGYEVNLTGNPDQRPERIDTRAESFSVANLHQLIIATVRPKLVISMDIPERGEQSWLAGAYMRAANGEPDAVAQIVQAANNLTDGNFSRIFDSRPNHGILHNDQNRVHMGYWRNRKGEMRDIRDFDYLAVLNVLAAKDPQAPVDWSATFDAVEIPQEVRLEKRAHMLRALSNQSFALKGFAQRLTWTAEFIMALNEACTACGLVARPSNLNLELAGNAGRAQYNAGAMAYGGQMGAGAGMFSYDNSPYAKNYQGIPSTFMTNWQRQ